MLTAPWRAGGTILFVQRLKKIEERCHTDDLYSMEPMERAEQECLRPRIVAAFDDPITNQGGSQAESSGLRPGAAAACSDIISR